MAKIIIKRTLLGLILGLAILPALVATIGLYLPMAFGIDPIFGDVDAMSIVKEGYILTKDDVLEFERFSKSLNQFAWYGIYLGLFASFIGCISVFIDKKNGIFQIENKQ